MGCETETLLSWPRHDPSAQRGISNEHRSARWPEVFSRAMVITVHNLYYCYLYSLILLGMAWKEVELGNHGPRFNLT